jgi:hypothetical protein
MSLHCKVYLFVFLFLRAPTYVRSETAVFSQRVSQADAPETKNQLTPLEKERDEENARSQKKLPFSSFFLL